MWKVMHNATGICSMSSMDSASWGDKAQVGRRVAAGTMAPARIGWGHGVVQHHRSE